MSFRLFQYALPAEPELADLNAFLASHRIATVHREVVATPSGPLLLFLVECVPGARQERDDRTSASARIDYRETLSEEQFAVFSSLREVRKRVAEADGVPVYAIFSNAQLAEMVQRKAVVASEMSKIDGVGKGRVDKYAAAFLPTLVQAFPVGSPPES